MADESKVWYLSKTIWSDILTLVLVIYQGLSAVLAGHGINLPPINGPIFGFVLSFLAGLGIVGRVNASAPVTLTSPK